jgi:hypothetical protein
MVSYRASMDGRWVDRAIGRFGGVGIGGLLWAAAVFGLVVGLALWLFPFVPGCRERPPGVVDTVSGALIGIATLIATLRVARWRFSAEAASRRPGRLGLTTILAVPIGAVLLVAALVTDHGCLAGAGLTYVNRTPVPLVVVDGESRSVIAACSQRSLGWSGTWGGTHAPEAAPPDAVAVSASWLRVAEAPPTLSVVVSAAGVRADSPGWPDPQDIPCEGRPPTP